LTLTRELNRTVIYRPYKLRIFFCLLFSGISAAT